MPTAGSNPTTAAQTTLTRRVIVVRCVHSLLMWSVHLTEFYKFNIEPHFNTRSMQWDITGIGSWSNSIFSGTNFFTLSLNNQTGSITTGGVSGTSSAGLYASFNYAKDSQHPTYQLIGDPSIPTPFNTNLMLWSKCWIWPIVLYRGHSVEQYVINLLI